MKESDLQLFVCFYVNIGVDCNVFSSEVIGDVVRHLRCREGRLAALLGEMRAVTVWFMSHLVIKLGVVL